jgi:NitT/TauT family transport system substrate-binding protein
MASYVGVDPAKDVNWVITPSARPKQLFIEGKIDAFLGFPPETQELHARNIGHVIANSAQDAPWSQYFCCLLAANTEFVERNPIAVKRALRAILKSSDICVSEPRRVARLITDRGYADRSDYVLQMLNELPYGVWRDYDPEDTIRFYALRTSPDQCSVPVTTKTTVAKRSANRLVHPASTVKGVVLSPGSRVPAVLRAVTIASERDP